MNNTRRTQEDVEDVRLYTRTNRYRRRKAEITEPDEISKTRRLQVAILSALVSSSSEHADPSSPDTDRSMIQSATPDCVVSE